MRSSSAYGTHEDGSRESRPAVGGEYGVGLGAVAVGEEGDSSVCAPLR